MPTGMALICDLRGCLKFWGTVEVGGFFGLAGDEVDDLVLLAEFFLEGLDVDGLDGDFFFDGLLGGKAGGLSGDHPDAFKSQGAEGDVGEAGGAGDEEVGGLLGFGSE